MEQYYKKAMLREAIAKAGSVAALSRRLQMQPHTIRRWYSGGKMSIASECKLRTYLDKERD